MNLKNLRYLLHVAQTENISLSARELFIAQPSLSRLITETEKELGYPLFDRVGRKIVLNRNGEVFVRHARSILGSWDSLGTELDEYNHKPHLSLTVGAEACSQLLPSILQLFQARQPDARIQILAAFPLDLAKNRLDFLLKAENGTDSESSDPSGEILLREDILLALPKAHPLNSRREILYKDTLDYPYVFPSASTSLGNTLYGYFSRLGLTVPPRTTAVNNSYLQCEFVEKGLGISLIPSRSWNYIHGNRSLVLRKIKDLDLKRKISLSSNPDHYQTRLAKEFKLFLIRYFKMLDS